MEKPGAPQGAPGFPRRGTMRGARIVMKAHAAAEAAVETSEMVFRTWEAIW